MLPRSGTGNTTPEPRVISNWTIDSLYTHLMRVVADLEERLAEHFELNEKRLLQHEAGLRASIMANEKALQASLLASDKAIQKAELASEKRFDSVNEFRQAMQDQGNKFISRTEVDQRILAVTDKINDLGDRMNRMEGRGVGLQTSWSVLVAAISVIILIVGIVVSFLKH